MDATQEAIDDNQAQLEENAYIEYELRQEEMGD